VIHSETLDYTKDWLLKIWLKFKRIARNASSVCK